MNKYLVGRLLDYIAFLFLNFQGMFLFPIICIKNPCQFLVISLKNFYIDQQLEPETQKNPRARRDWLRPLRAQISSWKTSQRFQSDPLLIYIKGNKTIPSFMYYVQLHSAWVFIMWFLMEIVCQPLTITASVNTKFPFSPF